MTLEPLDAKPDWNAIRDKYNQYWQVQETYKFNEKSKKKTYSIDSPPPFTSGALHMGHMLSYSYFDFAARYKRMTGHEVFYPQGWDCQGFPTEVKVEKQHGRNMPRAEFLAKCVEFTEENIEKMRLQMQQMGFSPDWTLEYKTKDATYHKKVQYSLLQSYKAGDVYKAKHPVMYCTNCRSAIAKAETEDEERTSKLNYINFTVKETGKPLTIATSRPELIHACVAMLVNPTDARYKDLIGKTAITPIYGKEVKIIAEHDVDATFGTGALMTCTFGDKLDAMWMYRHNLQLIEAMDENGKIKNSNGTIDGLSVNAAREKIIELLREKQLLIKQETINNQVVKVHDRCKKPTEYLATTQWFIKLNNKEQVVKTGSEMRWIPEFSLQYLKDWADFVDYDWVISRSRTYGTPLPFYNCNKCHAVHTPNEKELPVNPALETTHHKCKCGGEYIGETAVADCWVDSSITPLINAGWPDNKQLMEKVYPASLRPQGLEIIRTWAFYTITRCLQLTGKAPFETLLINGNVLGTDGKKMSKSLGNYEDPAVLLAKYPSDALRQWAAMSGAFAKDRPFSYKDIEYASNFIKKVYNAAKLAQTVATDYIPTTNPHLTVVDKWMLAKLDATVQKVNHSMENYAYFDAINAIHQLFWNDFCDYYLEDIKYRIYDNINKQGAQHTILQVFNTVLKLLAPFTPYLSEELYHKLGFAATEKQKSIHSTQYPQTQKTKYDREVQITETLHEIIRRCRKFKADSQVSLAQELTLIEIKADEKTLELLTDVQEDIKKICRAKQINLQAGENLETTFKL